MSADDLRRAARQKQSGCELTRHSRRPEMPAGLRNPPATRRIQTSGGGYEKQIPRRPRSVSANARAPRNDRGGGRPEITRLAQVVPPLIRGFCGFLNRSPTLPCWAALFSPYLDIG